MRQWIPQVLFIGENHMIILLFSFTEVRITTEVCIITNAF